MDPNRHKNPGLLLANIRSEIEPTLLAAGFRLVGRNNLYARRAQFIEYARPNELFSVTWDQHEAILAAELVSEGGDAFREVASAILDGVLSPGEIDDRLAPFMACVQTYLDGLPGSHPQQGS
jgi:hypothetical protein